MLWCITDLSKIDLFDNPMLSNPVAITPRSYEFAPFVWCFLTVEAVSGIKKENDGKQLSMNDWNYVVLIISDEAYVLY